MSRRFLFAALFFATIAEAKPKTAPAPPPPPQKGTLWVFQSEEFGYLTHEIYAMATGVVVSRAALLPASTEWAVVLDVDETVLDNSVYQLETPVFSEDSWATWEARKEAIATPGAPGFVAAVRHVGGHVVYVTNRRDGAATIAVLKKQGLWAEGDLMCATTFGADSKWISEKATRRGELRTGKGGCSLDKPTMVLAYVGDQRGDFPDDGEETADPYGLSPWGSRYFMLPNPMYGKWADKSTRLTPHPPPTPAATP